MSDSGMTRPVGIMPNHLDLREITFTNLLLLDFNPAEMESKYRVVFNRDMFALPNKKAMEVIMHFLFTKLHPQLAYEEFRDCWPVRDKVLEQQFRKVCFNWVSRIQKEDPEARLPRIVQSLFHSPGGDRFCGFLHHFSLYILTKVMYRDHGKIISIPTFPIKTVHNHSFTHVMSRALEAHYIVLKKRFLEFTQHAVQVEHHWKEYAMETTKEFRSLVKKKRDLQRQVMEMDGMIAPQGSSIGVRTDYQEEVEVLKRTQQLQKVRDLWAGIEEFYTVQAPQRKIVDSVLQGEANKYHIDAADIQPKVPDMLLRDCEREIKKRNVEDTYVGGKVNLFSIIQLWNLSLSKIKEQLNQEPLPSFDDQCPAVRSALHTHHAHLTNTTALREAIEETMPAMKGSIKEMKLQCYKSLEQQHSRPAQAPVLFKLGLVPPTPPVSFAAADTPAAERITSFHSTLKMSPDTVLTPDVIQAWTKTVRRLDDKQESVTKLAKNKKAGPSRLPRPKQHVQPGTQTGNTKPLTSKSTQKKKKKPTQGHAEKSFSYPHYVTPRSQEPKKESKESPLILKPQTILANQIADAVAMDETTSSSLSSTATSSRTSTPKAQALVDPAGALGQDAFQPRDLIPRTPAKKESDETCTEPRSEYKPGLLLETILDESPGSAIPSPAEEKHSTDPSAQAVLSWTDINFTPKLLKTSSFQESPPERDPLWTSLGTGLGFTDVKRTPDVAGDEEFKEPVPFNLSNIEPTPKSVKKSLFEDSPQPQEMLPSKQHAPLSHPFTRQTPESVRLPLVIESSPQLDFWLLPQNKNGNHPGSLATPNAIRTELFDRSPLENGNPSFDDLRFLSISGEQFTSQADQASATQPTPMRSPLSRHTTPKITAFSSDHKLDTTELAERLNRIKQAPLERDSWGLQHNTSLKPSTTKHTPKSADKAVNLQTQNVYATHQKALDSSGAHPSSTFSQPTQQTLQHSIHSEQRETVLTPSGAHPSPKPGTVFKENVSSSSYEVDTSALIQRLNKIKQTQQSFSAPHFIESISFEARAADSVPRKENDAETASDTSLLASRLDQIKQAQKSQQVTPGASTGEDLSTSRTSEPALLTPLTPSSRGTPSEDGNKNEIANFSFHSPQHVTSLPDSPSSPLDRNFVLQSPFKSNQLINSLLQQTPSPLSAGSELNSGGLGLFEDLHWETATPSLPQRLVTRAGVASEGNSSFVPATSNSLHSSAPYSISTPLLENSVHRPDCMTWVPGSSQTPASVGGFIEEEEQDTSPRLDLASPHSYRGNVPSHVTSPVIGKLIDLE